MYSEERKRILATPGSGATTPSGGAATVSNNDDLLAEILLRLPLKSLVRSKSISKHWLSLISSPFFTRRLNPNPNLPSDIKPTTSLPFFQENPNVYLLQSCKGLLCCCDSKLKNLYVVNPTTKQFKTLVQDNISKVNCCLGVNLAFDPMKSPHYKVILVRDCRLLANYESIFCQIEIYSSKTSTWKLSGEPFAVRRLSIVLFSRGVFWNGAINWVSVNGNALYFNVDQEVLATMPMPPVQDAADDDDDYHRKIRYFGESENHLNLVQFEVPHIVAFKIYEIEKDYSGWFVKYHVDLDQVSHAFPEIRENGKCSFSIVRIENNDDDDKSFLVLHIENKVIRYNLEEKTYEKIFKWSRRMLGSEYTRNDRPFSDLPYVLQASVWIWIQTGREILEIGLQFIFGFKWIGPVESLMDSNSAI
ncbi:F-box protein At5g07610-like [Camellia sinensis]|nr:F-box protein At5g07610-like [Camellia sinensis]